MTQALKPGQTGTFTETWQRIVKANPLSLLTLAPTNKDLSYGSGNSVLTSTGEFYLERIGSAVRVVGIVRHVWTDSYDWNPGQSFPMPDGTIVYDNDMILLEIFRGAAPFKMRCVFVEKVDTIINVGN